MEQTEVSYRQESSNYKDVVEKWKKDFTTWDLEAACKRLNFTDYDEESIRFHYFGRNYEIDRKTGQICWKEHEEYEPGFDESMNIYSLFYYSEEGAFNSGEWVAFRDVKSSGVFDAAFNNQVLNPFAKSFEGKAEAFCRIGEKLGFTPLKYGDGAFEIDVFDCVPIRVVFWDSDEEFPASMNIMFDKNVIRFTHPETVVMIGSECKRIFEEELANM